MNPNENPRAIERPQRSRFYAKMGAAAGFAIGGSVVFYIGLRAFAPPPAPAGTGTCGNAVLGGLLVIVAGAPLSAVILGLAGGFLGAKIDWALHQRRYPRR